jgi:hypothetical protein
MATGIVRRSYHRYDNVFFSAMAGLFLAFVFIGFAPAYYFAGLFRAPLPNLLVRAVYPKILTHSCLQTPRPSKGCRLMPLKGAGQ